MIKKITLPEGETETAVHRVGRQLQRFLPDVQLLLLGGVLHETMMVEETQKDKKHTQTMMDATEREREKTTDDKLRALYEHNQMIIPLYLMYLTHFPSFGVHIITS